jgi:hypothetical protein
MRTMEGRRTSIGLVVAAGCLAVGACGTRATHVTSQQMAPVGRDEIRRIALMPFTTDPAVAAAVSEPGQEPLPEPPADTVQRALAEAMARLPAWQLADDLVVGEALRKLQGEARAPGSAEAVAAGRLVGADAVLVGRVRAFEERVGAEFAAKRPARVDFLVELLRVPSGESLWRAEYAERQQALSDNLWNVLGFVRARGRWVRAGNLAAVGAVAVASDLHHALYGGRATPVPGARTSPQP